MMGVVAFTQDLGRHACIYRDRRRRGDLEVRYLP